MRERTVAEMRMKLIDTINEVLQSKDQDAIASNSEFWAVQTAIHNLELETYEKSLELQRRKRR